MKDQELLFSYLKDAIADYICETGETDAKIDVRISIEGGWADVHALPL